MTTTGDADRVVIDHVIGDCGRLVIRLAMAEVRLAATGGDRVVVRTANGRSLSDQVVVEPSDDGLTIREKETGGLAFGRRRRVVQLEIQAPPMAEIAIDTASGWLDVQGFTGEQRYRAVAGEVRLRHGSGQIELNTVSGDATIELVGATDLTLKAVSGDTVVRGGRLSALRIATTSGDVRVDSPLVGRSGNRIETLSGDVELVASGGMRVEARTISGDLLSDLPHRSEGRMGRRTLIVGDGSIELDFRSVSGDLRIHDGSGRSAGPVPPVPPLTPLAPSAQFSTGLDADFDPPGFDLPSFDLPGLDLPGFDVSGFGVPDVTGPPARIEPDATATPTTAGVPDADPAEAERMAVLRALEQGELDVATAMDRLSALDGTAGRTEEAADV